MRRLPQPLQPDLAERDWTPDLNRDVDQFDFGIFPRDYSGEGNPADPNCAN